MADYNVEKAKAATHDEGETEKKKTFRDSFGIRDRRLRIVTC